MRQWYELGCRVFRLNVFHFTEWHCRLRQWGLFMRQWCELGCRVFGLYDCHFTELFSCRRLWGQTFGRMLIFGNGLRFMGYVATWKSDILLPRADQRQHNLAQTQ